MSKDSYINWSVREFQKLPILTDYQNDKNIVGIEAVVIIPTDDMHDSGFKCMQLVPIVGGEPIGLWQRATDALSFLGNSLYSQTKIDCLPNSNLIRVFFLSANMTTNWVFGSADFNEVPQNTSQNNDK